MKTLSAISPGLQKAFTAGWILSFSSAFLLGFSRHFFQPFGNEFYSFLRLAACFFCFACGSAFLPSRKSRAVFTVHFIFLILLNAAVFFLLRTCRPEIIMLPVILFMAGRMTGELRMNLLQPKNYFLYCIGGAAAGLLAFYLLNNQIPSEKMPYLVLAVLLTFPVIALMQIRQLKTACALKILLYVIWLLLPVQFIFASVPFPSPKKEYPCVSSELKPVEIVQSLLQPNRKGLKVLFLGNSHSVIRQLSGNELTRKLTVISLLEGSDIHRKLNVEADDFDLILVQMPLPDNLYAERFYTIRFFQLLKDHLSDHGAAAVWLPEDALEYRKDYLAELYGSTGSILCKVFPHVKPGGADSLILLAGSQNLTNSPQELNDRAETLLSNPQSFPDKAFLMGTSEEQYEQERFFRTAMLKSAGQERIRCALLWNAIRNHPLLDRTVLGSIIDRFRGIMLILFAGLGAMLLGVRYFHSAGIPNKRFWLTWENGIYSGLVILLFLIPYQQYTGRLSRDWGLLCGFFLLAGYCGALGSSGRHHTPVLLKLLLGLTLLLPLCGFAFLNGYAPDPLIFYAALGYVGYTAGAVCADIQAEIPSMLMGLACGLILGSVLFWIPGGIVFAMILAVICRIPPLCAENLQKQFDKPWK